MVKLKKLEELTIDAERQLVGGNAATGSCYCSCSCQCDCNCSCACDNETYARSGSNRNSVNGSRIVGTQSNRRDSTAKSYRNSRTNDMRYN